MEKLEYVYVTYVVTPEELAQARRLFESVRVFDKKTPFLFVSSGVNDLAPHFRRLEDFYSRDSYGTAQVPWPEPGIPYKSMWQLPHMLSEWGHPIAMHLPFNALMSRDPSWLFKAFPAQALQGSVGFGINSLTKEVLPNAMVFDCSKKGTWRVFDALHDLKVSHWNEGMYWLFRFWHAITDDFNDEPAPCIALHTLDFQVISVDRLTGEPPNLRIDLMPTLHNVLVKARPAVWPHMG
jgi:hypothetical protein